MENDSLQEHCGGYRCPPRLGFIRIACRVLSQGTPASCLLYLFRKAFPLFLGQVL